MKSITARAWFLVAGVSLSGALLPLGCSAGSGLSSGVRGGDPAGGGASPSNPAGNGSDGGAAGGLASGGAPDILVNPGGSAGTTSCGSDSREAATVPLALYILLDQSGSMTLDANRWDPVSTALKSFVSGATLAGVGVGLQYFPLGASMTSDPAICSALNYASADVAIQDLPTNSVLLTSSIDKHYFTAANGTDATHWGTPTYPALEGSYAYLRGYLTANPSRRGVLLLATDGLPSKLCTGDTVKEITALIASQAALTPPIQTYIVGIGKLTTLNDWAVAGGTGHAAFIVEDGATTQQDLATALNEIRVLSLPCDYAIPTPMSGTIDPNQVNVRFSSPNQPTTTFLNVKDAGACAANAQTWYYDSPSVPTRVIMCPSACNALHQPGVKIEIVFGCATEVYVPK